MHYTGWLYDAAAPENKGKQFDSSVVATNPSSFPLGGGTVITGWDQGVVGMKVGRQAPARHPSRHGLRRRAAPAASFPPGATLVFDVELVEIQ